MPEAQQPTYYNEGSAQQEIITLLKNTIEQLNHIVNKLNTESRENLPPREMVDTLVSNTNILAELFGQTAAIANPEVTTTAEEDLAEELFFDEEDIDTGEPTEPALVTPPVSTSDSEAEQPIQKLQSSRLSWPNVIAEKLSRWMIPGIIILVVMGVISLGVVLFSQSSLKLAENPLPTANNQPEVIATPPQLEAPGIPEPVELTKPKLELTPEQSLIAAIQTEVADLTKQYPEGLINSIEANFLQSRLVITLGDDWQQLSTSRQQNLANSILKRSRRLDFRKLELINIDGRVIARSPVVGEEMVIMKPIKD